MTARKRQATPPPRPYADFPLRAHKSGQWTCKLLGKFRYWGVWDDWQGALKRYLAERDYLYAGEAPPTTGTTIADVLNAYRRAKLQQLDEGALTQRTFDEYEWICDMIAETIGKHREVDTVNPTDLTRLRAVLGKAKSGKPVSVITLRRRLTFARMPFRMANEDMGCSVRYKKALRSPAAVELRRLRNETPERLFEAKEIRDLVAIASPQLKAMILLGINCGFGNKDCSLLPIECVNLSDSEHNFWRPKTQVPRRCPLWPETAAALYAVIQNRTSGLVFETKRGQAWTGKGRANPVSAEFRKLAVRLGIYRPGVTTFYSLRRTLQTIGETAGEPRALQHIMGHTPASGDMSAIYRQRTYLQSLRKVTDHVREWYLGNITIQ